MYGRDLLQTSCRYENSEYPHIDRAIDVRSRYSTFSGSNLFLTYYLIQINALQIDFHTPPSPRNDAQKPIGCPPAQPRYFRNAYPSTDTPLVILNLSPITQQTTHPRPPIPLRLPQQVTQAACRPRPCTSRSSLPGRSKRNVCP